MSKHVCCGAFDSEAYWRPPELATLPALRQPRTHAVEAMDEILFAFCEPGDSLITKKPMLDSHFEYLSELGFRFNANRAPIANIDLSDVAEELPPSIFELLGNGNRSPSLSSLIPVGALLDPFAVLPGIDDVVRNYELQSTHPPADIVRQVNAKSYGVAMRERISASPVGGIAEGLAEVRALAEEILKHGPCLIKDEFGVSGKGSLKIDSVPFLNSVIRHISKQGEKCVKFVIEPFLEKKRDFSAQLKISREGRVELASVSEMFNAGFSFETCVTAEKDFIQRLEGMNYFENIEFVAKLLYIDGYFGELCVDSMMLSSGDVVSIVEINARKSMSMVKNAISTMLNLNYGMTWLTSFAATVQPEASFEGLLRSLQRAGILYDNKNTTGVIPLTSGTMYDGNAKLIKPRLGKIYFLGICQRAEIAMMRQRIKDAMVESGLKV